MDDPRAEQAWELLKQVPPPRASGAFVPNTLRALRLASSMDHRASRPMGWWIFLLASASAMLLLVFLVSHPASDPAGADVAQSTESSIPTPALPELAEEEIDVLTEEFEVMTYVNELMAVTDPNLLDDVGLAELLF